MADLSAQRFRLRSSFLFGPFAALGGSRRLCGLSWGCEFRSRGEQSFELLQAIVAIARLISVTIAGHNHEALASEACTQALDQPLPKGFAQGLRRHEIPPQHGLAVDLLNVRSARA